MFMHISGTGLTKFTQLESRIVSVLTLSTLPLMVLLFLAALLIIRLTYN